MSNSWFTLAVIFRLCILISGIYLAYTSPGPNSIQFTNALLLLIISGIGK